MANNTISKIIKGTRSIKDGDILSIISFDPTINVDWLFTGRGEMFLSTGTVHEPSESYGVTPMEVIEDWTDKDQIREQYRQYKSELSRLKVRVAALTAAKRSLEEDHRWLMTE